jgi:hypothetical protein
LGRSKDQSLNTKEISKYKQMPLLNIKPGVKVKLLDKTRVVSSYGGYGG